MVQQNVIKIEELISRMLNQSDWLAAAQIRMSDVVTFAELSQLIGKLYSHSMTNADKSPHCIDHPNCHSLGQAYKKVLDIGKHGGLLFLPPHLWQLLLEHHHKYLMTQEQQYDGNMHIFVHDYMSCGSKQVLVICSCTPPCNLVLAVKNKSAS